MTNGSCGLGAFKKAFPVAPPQKSFEGEFSVKWCGTGPESPSYSRAEPPESEPNSPEKKPEWGLVENEKSAQSFSDRSFWKSLRVVDVRAFGSWMSAPKCLFFQDFEALTEVLGRDIRANDPRMSAGYPSPKNFLCGLIFRSCFRWLLQKARLKAFWNPSKII